MTLAMLPQTAGARVSRPLLNENLRGTNERSGWLAAYQHRDSAQKDQCCLSLRIDTEAVETQHGRDREQPSVAQPSQDRRWRQPAPPLDALRRACQ